MIVVVTDTCIFIDLWNIGLMNQFFELDLVVHTTVDVIGELDHEQQNALGVQNEVGQLRVHNLSAEDRIVISQSPYPKSLSEPDKSVLHLAVVLNALVISSDKVIRNYAKQKKLEYHGILWILEEMVNGAMLTPSEGLHKLTLLLHSNSMMQGSKEVMKKVIEMNERWKV